MRKALVLFAALAALCWQSIVLPGHFHQIDRNAPAIEAPAIAPAAVSQDGNHGKRSGSSDTTGDCPLCHELAFAGLYLPPPPVDFTLLLLPVFWLPVPEILRDAFRQRSHDWRSRAPPRPLHS